MSDQARVHRLRGALQRYAWGSRYVLAELLGRSTPSEEPEAELWLGAHPRGPALVELADDAWLPFDALLARSAEHWLGGAAIAAHGPRLPFLLKVLAVEAPLSLQTHPDRRRAAEVFAADRELDPARRRYLDPYAKPELVCALTRFEALCGFRPGDESRAWFAEAGLADLWPDADGEPANVRSFLADWLRLPAEPRARRLGRVVARARERAPDDAVARRVVELATRWPGDPGAIAPILMHDVTLAPGEALFLPPGLLHCYLSGVAVEIMGASDNVVRAGLTPKPVDVEELLRVASCEPGPVARLRGAERQPGLTAFATAAEEFELSRLELEDAREIAIRPRGPEIVLCMSGVLRVSGPGGTLVLGRGESCAIPAAAGWASFTGRGVGFRAALPEPAGTPR